MAGGPPSCLDLVEANPSMRLFRRVLIFLFGYSSDEVSTQWLRDNRYDRRGHLP